MSKDTIENKCPLVSIVLAVYKPQRDWFSLQLSSLNSQTYENLELIICDDCPDQPVEEEFYQKYLTDIPYTTVKNESNLGSNKTFENLTKMAKGEYIAYCDQDDIWCADKIQTLVLLLEQTKAKLVCSDVFVIDSNGNQISDSITKVRKRHVFLQGEGLSDSLLFRNFVIGCTMMMETALAKEAMPFLQNMVHDHWLALYASTKGRIAVAPSPLIYYRIHSDNQTNVLSNVRTKSDYVRVRIDVFLSRMQEIGKRVQLGEVYEKAKDWAVCRKEYSSGCSHAAKRLWNSRKINQKTTLFELLMLRMPQVLFRQALKLIQKGNL